MLNMLTHFSDLEKSMVKNMMMQKSHTYIANMLEKPIESISTLVDILANGAITKQMKLDAKKPVKKAKAPKAPKKKAGKTLEQLNRERKELQQKTVAREAKNQVERTLVQNREHAKRKYKSLVVDYSKLVTVRINDKTFIYAKPGEEEKAKKQFLKNYPLSATKFDHE